MLELIAKFFACEKMSSTDTCAVLNAIACFDIDNHYTVSSVNIDGTIINSGIVYTHLHENFCVEAVQYSGDKYVDSYIVLRDDDTNNLYRFSFSYDSYNDNCYDSGTWSRVQAFSKSVTYYADY